MARILIDGRFVGIGDSISRYTLELTKRILKLDSNNQYTLLIRPQGEGELERYPEIVDASNLKIDVIDIPHYSWDEQTKMLDYLSRENFDLVHFTQFNHPIKYKKNYIVTIHDLTMLGHLHRQSLVKRFAFGLVMKSAVKNAQRIIFISNTTKEDVFSYYKVNESKTSVIYLGFDHHRYNQSVKSQTSKIKVFKEKYKIEGNYILYTGMWKRHKNLIRLIQAYEIFVDKYLAKDNHDSSLPPQLVLVGKIDKNEPEVIKEVERVNKALKAKYSLNNSIVTTGFVLEEELPLAYAGAILYCIPSLSEGFGWPPLEAMACETPVISSNISCMPEILGQAPLYFDPYNIEDIAAKMKDALTNEALRLEMSKKGLSQVQKYDWDETAKQTLEVYKQVIELD